MLCPSLGRLLRTGSRGCQGLPGHWGTPQPAPALQQPQMAAHASGGLPRAVVESPALEVLMKRAGVALRDLA